MDSQNSNSEVARTLDLCDRVSILSHLVNEDLSQVMDESMFDSLTEPYYPSLVRFCREVKDESNVVSVQAFVNDEKREVTFVATFEDTTCKTFTYDNVDKMVSQIP